MRLIRDLLSGHSLDQAAGELHLDTLVDSVVLVSVSPPIPAAVGVGRHGVGLLGVRVQHDDVVGLGPGVEASLGGVIVANVGLGLQAAVE